MAENPSTPSARSSLGMNLAAPRKRAASLTSI